MTSQSQAPAPDPVHPTEHLSAVMDGEADDGVLQRVCEAWREQTGTRQAWHAYHLIGDVLRSDELTSDAELDSAFLRRLRARLADEPVVLAPVAGGLPTARRAFVRQRSRWQAWSASAAVAAGFVAVAGVLLVTQEQEPTTLAVAAPASPAPIQQGSAISLAPPAAPELTAATVAVGGPMLRNPLVDRYLEAHKGLGMTNVITPSRFMQSTAETPSR